MSAPKKRKPRFELGVKYEERKNNPPPGLVWRRVKNGETLFTIAEEYKIRPIDLVLYNWHTIKEAEINWYLYEYVGCRQHKGDWYVFSAVGDKNKGWILVPEMPPELKKSPLAKVDAVRNGSATFDNKLQVRVIERLASGRNEEVSGKWLYVFSGEGSVDFGYRRNPWTHFEGAPNDSQPGSAFTPDFPGYFYISEKPDKLEYEILITSQKGPSDELLMAATGSKEQGKPIYEYGNKWYFLSDQTFLDKAWLESRENRTTHAGRNSKLITIDLKPHGVLRRYYFLLSPIQLGPEAVKFAMNNPQGLTPLLKADLDDSGLGTLSYEKNVGPTPDDIKQSPITLPVIDPFAWAEDISETVYEDAIKQYVDWLNSKYNETLKELFEETGWPTLDHLFVAQMLEGVIEKHPDKGEIEDELKDPAKWRENLKKFQDRLLQKTIDITAKAHRELLQLLYWLESPAHKIIETAILKDAVNDTPQDAIDVGHGILHWAVCTENIVALEPGVVYLQQLVNRPNVFPNEVVFRHFKDLDKANFKPFLNETQIKAFRYSYAGVLSLLSLKDFVSDLPLISPILSRQGYLEKLAEYNSRRRDNLIKFFNEMKILPVKVGVPHELLGLRSSNWNWTVGSTALNSTLDIIDKWTTYIIDPKINFKNLAPKYRIFARLTRIEEWFEKRKRFAVLSNYGSSYALKAVAFRIGLYNMWAGFYTARYDYQKNQMTVSGLDRVSAVAGFTLALQDLASEVATVFNWTRMQTLFPQLMAAESGPAPGVGVAVIKGTASRISATINVLAMVVSGVVTIISGYRNEKTAMGLGDYTAAKFYEGAILGGISMTAGAFLVGIALVKAGITMSSTGWGATIGFALILVGGVVSAIGTIGGSMATSDDYEVFARKCFLGKQGNLEPRFGPKKEEKIEGISQREIDPPDWSLAAKSGTNTWPIEKQKKAIFNLLGRFMLKSKPQDLKTSSRTFQGMIDFELKTGLLTPKSQISISLQYGKKGEKTTVGLEYNGIGDFKSFPLKTGELFNTQKVGMDVSSASGKPNPEKFGLTLFGVNYDSRKGKLLAEVSIRFPETGSVVICRKLVIEMDDGVFSDKLEADDNEELSAIFS